VRTGRTLDALAEMVEKFDRAFIRKSRLSRQSGARKIYFHFERLILNDLGHRGPAVRLIQLFPRLPFAWRLLYLRTEVVLGKNPRRRIATA
jgi:hypothetical protein